MAVSVGFGFGFGFDSQDPIIIPVTYNQTHETLEPCTNVFIQSQNYKLISDAQDMSDERTVDFTAAEEGVTFDPNNDVSDHSSTNLDSILWEQVAAAQEELIVIILVKSGGEMSVEGGTGSN